METQGCPVDAGDVARIESLRRATARDGYDRDAFGTAYSSLEDEIIAALPPTMKANGQVYTLYSCLAFDITADGTAAPDIEHIVALGEAHDSGIADDQRRDIASDLDNLTIADPTVNRSQKSDLDAAKWMPMRHGAWFTEWVIQVKLEYGLSVDPAERDALEALLAGGEAQLNYVGRRASTGAPTPWGTRARLGAGTAQRLWVADPIRDCSLTHDFGQRLTALSLTAGLEPSTVPSPARGPFASCANAKVWLAISGARP